MKTVDCRKVYTHSLKEELDQLTKAEFSRYFRKHQRRREPRLLPIRYGVYFRDVVMPEWEGRLEGEGYLTWPLAQRVFNSMALEAAERQGGGNMEDLEKFLGKGVSQNECEAPEQRDGGWSSHPGSEGL